MMMKVLPVIEQWKKDYNNSFPSEYLNSELKQTPIDLPILTHPNLVLATLKTFFGRIPLCSSVLDIIQMFQPIQDDFEGEKMKKRNV